MVFKLTPNSIFFVILFFFFSIFLFDYFTYTLMVNETLLRLIELKVLIITRLVRCKRLLFFITRVNIRIAFWAFTANFSLVFLTQLLWHKMMHNYNRMHHKPNSNKNKETAVLHSIVVRSNHEPLIFSTFCISRTIRVRRWYGNFMTYKMLLCSSHSKMASLSHCRWF